MASWLCKASTFLYPALQTRTRFDAYALADASLEETSN